VRKGLPIGRPFFVEKVSVYIPHYPVPANATLFLKVCCIIGVEKAKADVAAGASAMGVVGPMPWGTGIITLDNPREICTAMAGSVQCFLLLLSALGAVTLIEQTDMTRADLLPIV
jgi:phosphoribosylanthranilate isomerase